MLLEDTPALQDISGPKVKVAKTSLRRGHRYGAPIATNVQTHTYDDSASRGATCCSDAWSLNCSTVVRC